MKFSLFSRALYADDGTFLKEVRCPLGSPSVDILPRSTGVSRCAMCSKTVMPIGSMSDGEVRELITKDPSQCVSFNLNTDMIKVIYGAHARSR
jgi:hypothetical protein